MINRVIEHRNRVLKLIMEADEPQLKGQILDILKKDLGVGQINALSFNENMDTGTVTASFEIPLQDINLYVDLEYKDNELECYVKFDQRDANQTKSVENNNMVIYPKSIPLLDSPVAEMLTKLKNSCNVSIKNILNKEK